MDIESNNSVKKTPTMRRYFYTESTPQGTFRKEMTPEQYEHYKTLTTFAERKAFMNPDNEVTE